MWFSCIVMIWSASAAAAAAAPSQVWRKERQLRPRRLDPRKAAPFPETTMTSSPVGLPTLNIPPLFSSVVVTSPPTASPHATLDIPPLFPAPHPPTTTPTTLPTGEMLTRATPEIPLPPQFLPPDDEDEQEGEQFWIRMILTLHYVTNVTEEALGRPLEEDAIHYRFCSAVKEQSAGVQAAYWAARDSFLLYTRPNDEIGGCTVLGTNRVYHHGDGGYGLRYFSLEVDLTQQVLVSPLLVGDGGGRSPPVADESLVASYVYKGFDFGGGGRRKFINLLRRTHHADPSPEAAAAFIHVVDATVRSGMLSPPMAAPTMAPTRASLSEVPPPPPSAVPSQWPSAMPVALPASSSSVTAAPSIPGKVSETTTGAPSPSGMTRVPPTGMRSPPRGNDAESSMPTNESNEEYEMNSKLDDWQEDEDDGGSSAPSSGPSDASSMMLDADSSSAFPSDIGNGTLAEDNSTDVEESPGLPKLKSKSSSSSSKSLHPLIIVGTAGVVIGLGLLACAVVVICRRPRESLFRDDDKSGYSSTRGGASKSSMCKTTCATVQKKKKKKQPKTPTAKKSMEDAVVVRKKRRPPLDVRQHKVDKLALGSAPPLAPKKDVIVDANSLVDSSVGELTADGGRSAAEGGGGYSSCGFESEAESSRTHSGHWRGGTFYAGASVVSSVAYTEAGHYSLDHGIREEETTLVLGPDGKPKPRVPKPTTDEEAIPHCGSDPVDLDESVAGTVNSAEDLEAPAPAAATTTKLKETAPREAKPQVSASAAATAAKKPSLASCIMPKCMFGAPVDLDDSFRTLDTTTSVSTPPRPPSATSPPPPSSTASSSHHPDLEELERQFQQPRLVSAPQQTVMPPLLPPLLARTSSKVDDADMDASCRRRGRPSSSDKELVKAAAQVRPPTPPVETPASPGWAAAFAAGTAAILTASLGRCASPSLDVGRPCASPTPVVVDGVESGDEENPPLPKKGDHSPVHALTTSATDTTSQSTQGDEDDGDEEQQDDGSAGLPASEGSVQPQAREGGGEGALTFSPPRQKLRKEKEASSPMGAPTVTTAGTESSPHSGATESVSDLAVPAFASWHISSALKATATMDVLEVATKEHDADSRDLDESERDDRSTMEKDCMVPIQERRHVTTPSQDEEDDDDDDDDDLAHRKKNPWLFGVVTETVGPGGGDWESLGGHSTKSCPLSGVGTGTKRGSVTRELLALEQQLALLSPRDESDAVSEVSTDLTMSEVASVASTSRLANHGDARYGTGRMLISLDVPAGRLGAVMANRSDGRGGTVVSALRNSSPLFGKLKPGDRIMAVDEEDVSNLTVSELTAVMGRKADKPRVLTVLTLSKIRLPPTTGM